MTVRSERDVILEHALRDEENLGIALKIGQAYHDLCGRVIVSFLEAVEKELTPRLGSMWAVTICHSPAELAIKDCLEAHFLSRPGKFRVTLTADEPGYPKVVYFAVRSEIDASSDPALLEHVRESLSREYMNGRRTNVSIWVRLIDKAYSYWGSEDATLLLYRKEEALTYFVDHLERLARVVQGALADQRVRHPLENSSE